MTKPNKYFLPLLLLNWIVVAVIPCLIILAYLVMNYRPLQGIGHEHIFVRGTILEKRNNSIMLQFQESSTFWDTSDVGQIGGNLELLNTGEIKEFDIHDKVVVKGSRSGTRLGQLSNITIYPNHFQPTGVDWSKSLLALFVLLSLVNYFFTRQMFFKR